MIALRPIRMLHCQWWKPCPYQGGISGNFNSYNYYNLDQPSLEDLVICQVKIKDNYSKKLSAYDKILGSVHAKLETLFSTTWTVGRFRGNPNLPQKM
jgi:hypothetical protein